MPISRQVVGDYLHTPEGRAKIGDLDGRVAANAGAAVVNPVVEQLITAEALIDLLDDGWPQRSRRAEGARRGRGLARIRLGAEAVGMFFASESNGFRSVTIPVPPAVPSIASSASPCGSAGRRGV